MFKSWLFYGFLGKSGNLLELLVDNRAGSIGSQWESGIIQVKLSALYLAPSRASCHCVDKNGRPKEGEGLTGVPEPGPQ